MDVESRETNKKVRQKRPHFVPSFWEFSSLVIHGSTKSDTHCRLLPGYMMKSRSFQQT